MKKSCTLCGCSYGDVYTFKGGGICEECLQYLKADVLENGQVRANDNNR